MKLFLTLVLTLTLANTSFSRERCRENRWNGTNYFNSSHGDIRFDRYAPKFVNEHGYLVPSSAFGTYVQSNNIYSDYRLFNQVSDNYYVRRTEPVKRKCPGLVGFIFDFLFGF